MSAQQKTVAEFFAGIGLMRMGLENAGWQILFANDIDHDKRQMYIDHFGDNGEFVIEDIHNLRTSMTNSPLSPKWSIYICLLS